VLKVELFDSFTVTYNDSVGLTCTRACEHVLSKPFRFRSTALRFKLKQARVGIARFLSSHYTLKHVLTKLLGLKYFALCVCGVEAKAYKRE